MFMVYRFGGERFRREVVNKVNMYYVCYSVVIH